MRFVRVRLEAQPDRLAALADFYGRDLGLELASPDAERVAVAVGETTIEFVAGAGAPFYHFALLVPGDRFDDALEWARRRADLLPSADSGDVVFEFDNWNASACYFADPAGNIVELIAHRGRKEGGTRGQFAATELVGLSELGLVGDLGAMAERLADELGLELWEGSVDDPARLAFVGERMRTFILAAPGRGWLPTGRPAEPHPVDVLLAGGAPGAVDLEGGLYRIARDA